MNDPRIRHFKVVLEGSYEKNRFVSELLPQIDNNLIALSKSYIADLCIVTLIVKDPIVVDSISSRLHFHLMPIEFIAVSVDPEGASSALAVLAKENVKINNTFSFSFQEETIVCLDVEEWQKAIRLFWDNNVKVLEQNDFNKFS